MVVFTVSVLGWKYPFRASLVQKMKIVSFSWNLVLSVTEIWRIQWLCSPILFLNGNILFMANLFQKIKIVCWSWNLEPRLIRIYRIRWWFSFHSFSDWKYSFWANMAQNFKIVTLSWNLVTRLFRICKIKPNQSPSSLFAETWSNWLFLLLFGSHIFSMIKNLKLFLIKILLTYFQNIST